MCRRSHSIVAVHLLLLLFLLFWWRLQWDSRSCNSVLYRGTYLPRSFRGPASTGKRTFFHSAYPRTNASGAASRCYCRGPPRGMRVACTRARPQRDFYVRQSVDMQPWVIVAAPVKLILPTREEREGEKRAECQRGWQRGGMVTEPK